MCSAFIIKEGHCQLMSRISPFDVKFDADGNLIGVKSRTEDGPQNSLAHPDKRRSGYMSATTNTFQFGMKGKYNWVGEDILVLPGSEPMYYSAIAKGRVVALEISRNDITSKIPVVVVKAMEKGCRLRREWFS